MKKPDEYTTEDIKAWLLTLPKGKIIGTCRDPHNCLIANFLLAMGYREPSVQPYGTNWREPYIAWREEVWQQRPMPDELQQLASDFDDLSSNDMPITAIEALDMLTEQ